MHKPWHWFTLSTLILSLACSSTPEVDGDMSDMGDVAGDVDGGTGSSGDDDSTSGDQDDEDPGGFFDDGDGGTADGMQEVLCDGGPCDAEFFFTDAGPACGDGVLNAGEACDDGNPLPGDGCNGTCQLEPFSECETPGEPCRSTIVCGDGQIDPGEFCDDGNTADGDGCNSKCEADPAYFCAMAGQPCQKLVECGDGRVGSGEECDDGNAMAGDGCSDSCQLEMGFSCPVPGQTCEVRTFCGDGSLQAGEACDDGNMAAGDGCSANCQVEADWQCDENGTNCIYTVVCGDAVISGDEACDDGNTSSGDGCNADCTAVEQGWECNRPGFACEGICGDGLIRGKEECEDDDGATPQDGDGCSSTCRIEGDYVCDAAGEACRLPICGDNVKEGNEPCDDGDDIHSGDGCSPGCVLEPNCRDGGACSSSCGDGLMLSSDNEACDDGNDIDGDGCSAACTIETGWDCPAPEPDALPDALDIPVVYRDFIHQEQNGSTRHPDFEEYSGDDVTPGLVENSLSWLDGEPGLPVYTGVCEAGGPNIGDTMLCPYNEQTTSQADFDQWYRDTDGVNVPVGDSITFTRQAGTDTFVFDVGGANLFPLDDQGWVALDQEAESDGHNFGFTTELRYWFEYQGDESGSYPFLEFTGDDDVWVFIGGQLAVDVGGLHPKRTRSVTLDQTAANDLGLVLGNVYEIALFHAERHTNESNFKLTLGGFTSTRSECSEICGDGIIVGDEICDDGPDNSEFTGDQVEYGKCSADCRSIGPYCGDDNTDVGFEECDNGVNRDAWGDTDPDACAPGCMLPPACGDGAIDTPFEECDDGDANTDTGYDGCTTSCLLGPFCGDGVVQEAAGETCDDGVNDGVYGSCTMDCKQGPRCGDGVLQEEWGEQCDDDSEACSDNCRLGAQCGDGVVQEDLNEECDDGVNDGGYGECGPMCTFGARCGDGVVQKEHEQCDDGVNDGGYGECAEGCRIGERCGDGVVQEAEGETCDDGNNESLDGCSAACQKEGKKGAK